MKNAFKRSTAATLLALPVLVLAGWFGHDRPPADGQPLSVLIKQVEDAGYRTIFEVEFENGVYEVEALDAKGKKVELKVDPASGKISVE